MNELRCKEQYYFVCRTKLAQRNYGLNFGQMIAEFKNGKRHTETRLEDGLSD